jgi:hypothetical protein
MAISLNNLDPWQKEILDYRGDIILCKGRRIGGTEIFAIKAVERMISDPGTNIVMVSLTEDQAKLIVSVAMDHLVENYRSMIGKGKNKPTQDRITLTNKSRLEVRPVGATGNSVRGFDGDILGIDEAPWQPAQMWRAARPVITTNNGEIWMWGTPAAREGYFWEQYDKAYNKQDPGSRFKVWHKNSEEVLFNRPISDQWTQEQHDGAIRILAEEKKDMTTIEYGNEYLGLFLDELQRFFPDELIEKCSTLQRGEEIKPNGKLYLGCDIARLGGDQNSMELIEDPGKFPFLHKESIAYPGQLTPDTERDILKIAELWKVKKIGIDAGSGGLGVSVYDHLRETKYKNKLLKLNNRSMAMSDDNKDKQRLAKEDFYNNLKSMMEHGELLLLNDEQVKKSLRSVQFAFGYKNEQPTKFEIFSNPHSESHIVEGIVRAAWIAKKEKSLNLWAY